MGLYCAFLGLPRKQRMATYSLLYWACLPPEVALVRNSGARNAEYHAIIMGCTTGETSWRRYSPEHTTTHREQHQSSAYTARLPLTTLSHARRCRR